MQITLSAGGDTLNRFSVNNFSAQKIYIHKTSETEFEIAAGNGNLRAIVNGSGFGFDGDPTTGNPRIDNIMPTSGMVDAFKIVIPAPPPIGPFSDQFTVTDKNWAATDLFAALRAISTGNTGLMAQLFQSAGTIDLITGPRTGPEPLLFEIFAQQTSSISTISDSPPPFLRFGGAGNDSISVASDSSLILATLGKDTYDFSTTAPGAIATLHYHQFDLLTQLVSFQDYTLSNFGAMIANLDMRGDKGTISGSGYNHIFNGLKKPTDQGPNDDGYLLLFGTKNNDVFNVTGESGHGLSIVAGFGADTYNVEVADDSHISLSFAYNSGQGLQANTRTGAIANDGNGFRDQINVTGNAQTRLFLSATNFDDRIVGSTKDESVFLGGGTDFFNGGGGFDIVRYNVSSFRDGVTVDLATCTGTGARFTGGQDIAASHTLKYVEGAWGSNSSTGGDTLLGNKLANELKGFAGDDMLRGQNGKDTLDGGVGDDSLYGGGKNDKILGGAGSDFLNGGKGNDTIRSDAGSLETLIGGDGNDLLIAEGASTIFGGNNKDKIFASNFGDFIFAGNGNDTVNARMGDDFIKGGNGNDLIRVANGNNTIEGGAGNDTMSAGADSDVFIFGKSHGQDQIQKFSVTQDFLQLNDALWMDDFGTLSPEQVVAQFAAPMGANVVLTFKGGESITLENVASTDGLADLILIV